MGFRIRHHDPITAMGLTEAGDDQAEMAYASDSESSEPLMRSKQV